MLPVRPSSSAAAAFLIAVLLGAPTGVVLAAPTTEAPAPRSGKLSANDAQVHAMAGEMAAGRGMAEEAAEQFLKALDFAPDANLAGRATAYALAAKREDLALEGARRWLIADPAALEAREVLLRLSLKAGNGAAALEQARQIVQNHPGGEADGFRHVALLASQDKTLAAPALAMVKTLVADRPQSAGAQRALSLLAYRFDDLPLAERAAREALRLAPGERESTLLLVGALVKKGDTAGADAAFETLAATQKDGAADLRLGYARLLIDASQRGLAKEQLGRVLKADANNADAHFAYGLLLLDERRWDAAEEHFLVLAAVPQRAADASYYLGRIAEQRKQYDAALKLYEKVDGGSQGIEALLHRALVMAKMNRLPESRELLRALRDQYPPIATRSLMLEADLLADADNAAAALALYDGALKVAPDDTDLLYGRSLLHERLKRTDLAEKDLRQVIAADTEDARALNALGYLLLTAGDRAMTPARLEESSRLIGKAKELSPDDPAVLDSWGWVQVKQGRLREGLPHLQRAYELMPDPEVAAHLGETFWLLGDRDKARAVWGEAAREDGEHKVLKETMLRLQGGK